MVSKEANKTPSKCSLSNTDISPQISAVIKLFSEMEFCELFSKLDAIIEKLTNEVLPLKLSNDALSMQMTVGGHAR